VTNLPFITNEFPELILHAESDDTPSCSLAEALLKQDLFINSTLAHLGASLLWKLLREGFVCHRGVFLNLQTFCTTPIGI
jgi:hypothetical protein